MKILFICGSIEPGRDGVGDYTRKLAGEIIKTGSSVSIIALNDRYIKQDKWEGRQSDNNESITVLRLSHSTGWKFRTLLAQKFINAFNPEWVSLQYVPYAFNIKGIPIHLPKVLRNIAKERKWHIMFHEMWIGVSPFAALKHKFYGSIQRYITLRMIKMLKPRLLTTTNLLYQLVMQKSNINVSILPLMSNISKQEKDAGFLSQIEEKYSIDFTSNRFFIIGIFGTLYPDAKISLTVPQFIRHNNTEKNNVVIAFGKNNNPLELKALRNNLNGTVKLIELGELSSVQISSLLSVLNVAVLCTPEEYIGKSGAFAAFKLHEVRVITPASLAVPAYREEIEKYNALLNEKSAEEWSVESVSKKFCALLEIA